MKELRKQVYKTLNDINEIWVKQIEEDMREGQGINLLPINGKVIGKITELDDKFNEAEQRIYAKKGKNWMGL